MCDYSLEYVASRPAQVADRLVTTSFPGTITRGFAAPSDNATAVCLRPGTELAFEQQVTYEHPVTHALQAASSRMARFRQIDVQVPRVHHDVLEFASGEIVPLTRLTAGQHATVLQLPATPLGIPQAAAEQPTARQPIETMT